MFFPGESIYSSNRHVFSRRVYLFVEQTCFSRRVYMFFKQTRIFQECLSNRHVFFKEGIRPYYLIEQILISPEALISSYEFSRSLYFLIEQIFIFKVDLSSPQTHIIFQETHMPRIDRDFPGRYPPPLPLGQSEYNKFYLFLDINSKIRLQDSQSGSSVPQHQQQRRIDHPCKHSHFCTRVVSCLQQCKLLYDQ